MKIIYRYQEYLVYAYIHANSSYYMPKSVWVYYHNQSVEITDKFNEDKVCYVKIADGNKTLYLTVKYQNGYSYSPQKYIEPEMFN